MMKKNTIIKKNIQKEVSEVSDVNQNVDRLSRCSESFASIQITLGEVLLPSLRVSDFEKNIIHIKR